MIGLSGTYTLITGSARRVGKAMALAIARTGGNVIVHYHSSDDEAKTTQHEIRALGVDCQLIRADLTDLEQLSGIIPQAAAFGPLHGLINNASLYQDMDLGSLNDQAWQANMNLHARAPLFLARDFAHAVGEGRGRIINILDWEIERPDARRIPYISSKATLHTLTQLLARELAPRITVNALALGAVLPPEDSEMESDPEHVPMGDWVSIDDVTEAIVFLLTGPTMITGEMLHVDGGRHLI